MPEQLNQSAIVPTAPTINDEMTLTYKDIDEKGKLQEYRVPAPTSPDFKKWTIQQQIGMLKNGMWKAQSVANIYWGLAYAYQIGADPIMGDIFPTGEGRWGTSNKYKIRMAKDTGNIIGIETEITDTKQAIELKGCAQKTDLECTVKIHVKGWVKPIVRKARLSRWYKEKNPNWAGNPEHMLELNTIAHACEYVPGVKLSTDSDEAPPLIDAEVIDQAFDAAKTGAQNG